MPLPRPLSLRGSMIRCDGGEQCGRLQRMFVYSHSPAWHWPVGQIDDEPSWARGPESDGLREKPE